jgi:signal transduction histidine kinase
MAGVGLALLVAVAVMVWLMKPPMSEVAALVRTLGLTSILSLGAGFLLYRRGLARLPSLSLTLVLAYAWATLLTLVNVLVLASLMFVSEHDLALSLVLMLFAAIIAMTFGVFVAASVTDSLRQLAETAKEVARGNFAARAAVRGRDEVAQVATAFNEMARQLEQGAERRQQVETLRRDLIAWTSHDLRTPLTSIRAMVEALDDGVVEDEAMARRYYQVIRSDVMALNRLIDDLFELAQLETGGIQMVLAPHSLRDLISDTLESFRVLAQQRGIRLEGEVSAASDAILVDAGKISRALNNIVANAIGHAPEGGCVTILAESAAGNSVRITVEDDGPGFAEEDLPRVFEQFYRGEEARTRATGGAGLGLAIGRAIVEAHGGRMWARNREGGGASVGFHLPHSPPEAD